MIFVTGDKHSDFSFLPTFCERFETTRDDLMIILGDCGINYYENLRDILLKQKLSKLPITLFCVHGNHEQRPKCIPTYTHKYIPRWGGLYYIEEEYPNILFPCDGLVYNLEGFKCLVLGGAYSVDKFYRLENGWKWFANEQISTEDRAIIDCNAYLGDYDDVNYVLAHTCPLQYEPREVFLPMVDQSTVDKTMEVWLDSVYNYLNERQLEKFYCGHYHIDKIIDKCCFMFNDIRMLGD